MLIDFGDRCLSPLFDIGTLELCTRVLYKAGFVLALTTRFVGAAVAYRRSSSGVRLAGAAMRGAASA